MNPTYPVTAAKLAAQALCSERDARRYLTRKHGPGEGGVWQLTALEYGAAYDTLKQRGAVFNGRAAHSAGAATLANSNAQTKSRRER